MMSCPVITNVAPTLSGSNSSRPKMSNEKVVSDSTRSRAVRPGSRAMLVTKLVRAPWRTITPLGRPVEPEV
ncbi:hypothetical protein D9M71_708970 [compost metagenome]